MDFTGWRFCRRRFSVPNFPGRATLSQLGIQSSTPEQSSENRVLIYHLRDVIKTREAEGVAFRLVVPSLQIALGEKIALIGQSGSGKSTLLDILTMVLQPTKAGAFRFRPEPGAPPLDIASLWEKRKYNRMGICVVSAWVM